MELMDQKNVLGLVCNGYYLSGMTNEKHEDDTNQHTSNTFVSLGPSFTPFITNSGWRGIEHLSDLISRKNEDKGGNNNHHNAVNDAGVPTNVIFIQT